MDEQHWAQREASGLVSLVALALLFGSVVVWMMVLR
jgi:hypothetical protein